MNVSIELLLNKRDYDTRAFTKQIIALFGDRLTKAIHMKYKMTRPIEWKSIVSFPNLEGYITISGDTEVWVGDLLNTPQGEAIVTEENIDQFTNSIYYILKANILQYGTVEDILQHINFVEMLAKTLSETELLDALRRGATSEVTAIEDPTLAPILEKITRPTVFELFKTEELSEDQFTSLRMNAQLGKTKVQ